MSKPIGEETAALIPYANIDGRRVAVLHGRVAKTPDGRIHEVVTPATMMRDIAPVTKCTGWPVASSETQSAVHNEPCECQAAHNAAKLLEALENLVRFEEADLRQLEHLANRAIDEDIYGGGILLAIVGAIREGKKALAVPPRNCDVGTAEEQAHRFFAFCHAHRAFDTACSNCCPFKDAPDINHCQSGWGQLPYEAPAKKGGAK